MSSSADGRAAFVVANAISLFRPIEKNFKKPENAAGADEGNREFHGIRHPKNSRREFPGVTEFSAKISGNLENFQLSVMRLKCKS